MVARLGLFRHFFFMFCVVGELESLDSGCALFGNVSDDVSNGVGLVAKMSVGNVNHAEGTETFELVVSEEAVLHLGSYFLSVESLAIDAAGRTERTTRFSGSHP